MNLFLGPHDDRRKDFEGLWLKLRTSKLPILFLDERVYSAKAKHQLALLLHLHIFFPTYYKLEASEF